MARVGGIISFQTGGEIQNAKGAFTYNLGAPKRKEVIGSDNRVHGFTEEPQAPYIEGEITDRGDLDVAELANLEDTDITLQLANGKTVVLRSGFFTGDGDVSTDEGNIKVQFKGLSAQEYAS